MNSGFIKPLQSSTKPEILVKFRLVAPEIDLLGGRPLGIRKKVWIEKIHADTFHLVKRP